MSKSNVIELTRRESLADPLMEVLREGARQLLQTAIEVEVQEFKAMYADRKTADGKVGVVRNCSSWDSARNRIGDCYAALIIWRKSSLE